MTKRLTALLVGVNSPGYRSLALDYLQATALADARLDVALQRFDVGADTDPWWTAYRILSLDPVPDVLAMPVLCWTAEHVYTVARLVKQASPGTLIVVGGPEVGPIAEETLAEQPALDAIVRGEGEFAFCDLLHSHARGGDIAGVPGVTARDAGRVVSASDREPIADLDSIPSPFAAGLGMATDGSAYIETYRGCPHRCAYCFEGKGSTRIRSFSWERIAADIEAIAAAPGLQAFSFIDPVFNLTPDRLERLAELMAPHVARGVRLHTIEVDIERIDDAQATLLKRAGVVSVETGPQSVGARALDTCARSFDADRFRAGVEACKRAGISVECDLIIGLPGDTAEDVVAGLDFAIALDPGRVQLSTLHVLPGTTLWDQAAQHGLAFDRKPPHEVISTAELSFGELRRLEVLGNAAVAAYRARLTLPGGSR
ncbi:MAG TPA: radical SAM protein [Coriobacteriia bacterium]|nr:radical SAM protein [Coriobacteriia bacterium]